MNEYNQKALLDIEKYGCHILHVAAEDEFPPFSYSIGIHLKSKASEVIVVGLKQELSHFIINEYSRRVILGERFQTGKPYAGFLEGFEVLLDRVDEKYFDEYLGWAIWLYEGKTFEVLQMVYPNTDGIFPWDLLADSWFRSRQPILSS